MIKVTKIEQINYEIINIICNLQQTTMAMGKTTSGYGQHVTLLL